MKQEGPASFPVASLSALTNPSAEADGVRDHEGVRVDSLVADLDAPRGARGEPPLAEEAPVVAQRLLRQAHLADPARVPNSIEGIGCAVAALP